MPFVFFKASVADMAGLSVEALEKFTTRLHVAYDIGEPVWMVAGEMALRAAAPKKHKTPRELAARVMRVHDVTMEMLRR